MELREDTCTLSSNNSYRRQHTTYEVSDRDKGSAFLNLNFLIKDETSSLKGSLSDEKDVDFYNFSIPFMIFQRNYFGVEVYIDMPEGCDYDLTLYDEYYYKISFHVSENEELEKTDAIRKAFGDLQNAYSRKDENWREYLDKYNAVLKETEQNSVCHGHTGS